MPEKLAKVHRSEVKGIEKQLKLVKELKGKRLKTAILNPFCTTPRKGELKHYESAVAELGKDLHELPNATYNIFLDGVGNYYNLKVGIKGLDVTVPRTKLEKSVERVYVAVERAGWTSRDPGLTHNQECVSKVVGNLIRNGGDLEYFDRIAFFNHGRF